MLGPASTARTNSPTIAASPSSTILRRFSMSGSARSFSKKSPQIPFHELKLADVAIVATALVVAAAIFVPAERGQRGGQMQAGSPLGVSPSGATRASALPIVRRSRASFGAQRRDRKSFAVIAIAYLIGRDLSFRVVELRYFCSKYPKRERARRSGTIPIAAENLNETMA